MKPMPLRRGPFLHWLMEMADDAVVGLAWDGCQCPLARFLRDSRSVPIRRSVTFIDSANKWFYRGQPESLPRWARDVVSASDYDLEVRITAGQLRERLHERFDWPTSGKSSQL